jgi:hypothetical protein
MGALDNCGMSVSDDDFGHVTAAERWLGAVEPLVAQGPQYTLAPFAAGALRLLFNAPRQAGT